MKDSDVLDKKWWWLNELNKLSPLMYSIWVLAGIPGEGNRIVTHIASFR